MRRLLTAFFKGLVSGMILGGLATGLAACGLTAEKAPVQYAEIRTETEPIYNHFPDLPETAEIQWCSKSSEGIGLRTVMVYILAYYDHDISGELQGMKVSDQEAAVDLHFLPEGIIREQVWKHVENASFAFQAGIKDTQKMNTAVYIHEQGTILYIEAVGD